MYVASIHMPGCLPTSDPEEFTTCAEAWEYVKDQLEYDMHHADDETYEELLEAHNSINTEVPGYVYALLYNYSVELV